MARFSAIGFLAALTALTAIFVSRCNALSQFDPECKAPKGRFAIVSSPDVRGTSDIFWSSAFTILTCTWTILHLNIPKERTCCIQSTGSAKRGSSHSVWCDVKWSAKIFARNLKWMLLTIVAPEFILGKAIGEFVTAWNLREAMAPYAVLDGVNWELSHGFFADMGGFTWRREDDTDNRYPPSRLRGRTILSLRANQVIEKLPNVSAVEIHDKSKSNMFIKAVALGQVSWSLIQIVVRINRGLAVSQLELVTSAFCVCAVSTYGFLLAKPQGVEVPLRPLKLRRMDKEERRLLHRELMPLRGLFVPDLKPIRDFALGRIPNDFADDGEITGWAKRNSGTYALGMAVGGAIFGAIHIAGWNLQFPTDTEQQWWHYSSILITLLLPLSLYPVILHGWDKPLPKWAPWAYGAPWFISFGLIYAIARVFLLVETLRALFYLHPTTFVGTWASNYIPHVS